MKDNKYNNSGLTTPTPSDMGFVYNPDETPTPTPFGINFGSSILNTLGGWFNFDEVVAQIPYDVGENSAIPIIFKNASFDFSQFPNIDDIDHNEDRVDLLLYITRGEYTQAEPWNLYHSLDISTAQLYGGWHENFDYLRGYEEYSFNRGAFVFNSPANPAGGLVEAVGKYNLDGEQEPSIPYVSSCVSGYVGYVNWEDWKQSESTIMLNAYLVSNFDQFYWPIGDGSDVLAHYSVELSYYYASGQTPTPYIEPTPTPEVTPTPEDFAPNEPTPTPTPSMINVLKDTPTPTPTPYDISQLDFTENFTLLLEVSEILDGPLGGAITYSSDLNQISNVSCVNDVVTGMISPNSSSLTQIRLITKNYENEKLVWTESPGISDSDLFSKVSVDEPWNKIYITRNISCGDMNEDFTGHKLFDIQLKASTEDQLFYPHQEIKFDLWKLTSSNEKENKIGEFVFKSVNSDDTGWWSPLETSWDRSLTEFTPTPTPTPEDFAPPDPTPTPTPFSVSNLSNWFSFDSATLNISNDDFENIIFSNVNVNASQKPPSILINDLNHEIVAWSVVRRSFDHKLEEAYGGACGEECSATGCTRTIWVLQFTKQGF